MMNTVCLPEHLDEHDVVVNLDIERVRLRHGVLPAGEPAPLLLRLCTDTELGDARPPLDAVCASAPKHSHRS